MRTNKLFNEDCSESHFRVNNNIRNLGFNSLLTVRIQV